MKHSYVHVHVQCMLLHYTNQIQCPGDLVCSGIGNNSM